MDPVILLFIGGFVAIVVVMVVLDRLGYLCTVFYPLIVGLAILLALVCLKFGATSDWTKRLALSSWTLGPPIFFAIEWFFIKHQGRDMDKESFERYKYGQELNSKVWLAVATVVFAILYGEYFSKH